MITREEYREIVKSFRNQYFVSPFDFAYTSFVSLEYDKADAEYFRDNASNVIIEMRKKCWSDFQPYEKKFTTLMLEKLINTDKISMMSPEDAIKDFVSTYPEHIYDLALSNTQSRRSRAGKEFEAILELLLIGAGLPADAQGAIGKTSFAKNGLGKLVDLVSPGVVHYMRNKRNTTLISAKTTLRERWQEVPEEITRTGIREMYLATLDEEITSETLKILYESNVIIVTTKQNKEQNYNNSDAVITFEELLSTISEQEEKWKSIVFNDEEVKILKNYLQKQIEKHDSHDFVKDYYKTRLESLC